MAIKTVGKPTIRTIEELEYHSRRLAVEEEVGRLSPKQAGILKRGPQEIKFEDGLSMIRTTTNETELRCLALVVSSKAHTDERKVVAIAEIAKSCKRLGGEEFVTSVGNMIDVGNSDDASKRISSALALAMSVELTDEFFRRISSSF